MFFAQRCRRRGLPPYNPITHDGQVKSASGAAGPIVLTDGTRLYVQEVVNGRYVVAQVGVSGGETVLLDIPFSNASLDNISRDRTQLVVSTFTGAEWDQPLWVVPVVGDTPRPTAKYGLPTVSDLRWAERSSPARAEQRVYPAQIPAPRNGDSGSLHRREHSLLLVRDPSCC